MRKKDKSTKASKKRKKRRSENMYEMRVEKGKVKEKEGQKEEVIRAKR